MSYSRKHQGTEAEERPRHWYVPRHINVSSMGDVSLVVDYCIED